MRRLAESRGSNRDDPWGLPCDPAVDESTTCKWEVTAAAFATLNDMYGSRTAPYFGGPDVWPFESAWAGPPKAQSLAVYLCRR